MDPHEGQEPQAPTNCTAGCGFFGNPACENYCSKCYRDIQSRRDVPSAPSPSAPAVAQPPSPLVAPRSVPAPVPAPAAPAAVTSSASAESSPSKRNRCFTCNKSVGLLGFKCRCDHEFCTKHRHATEHACPFDYKSFDRVRLEKANPVVVASKIQQI